MDVACVDNTFVHFADAKPCLRRVQSAPDLTQLLITEPDASIERYASSVVARDIARVNDLEAAAVADASIHVAATNDVQTSERNASDTGSSSRDADSIKFDRHQSRRMKKLKWRSLARARKRSSVADASILVAATTRKVILSLLMLEQANDVQTSKRYASTKVAAKTPCPQARQPNSPLQLLQNVHPLHIMQ